MQGNSTISPSYIRAKKSLGQNFLIDEEALSDIAGSIEVMDKHIIEVGPGYGALTEYLIAGKPKSLDLVELDRDMIKLLKERFSLHHREERSDPGNKNEIPSSDWIASQARNDETFESHDNGIQLHNADVLHFTPPYEQYSVIANIPYYITSPILFHFLYPETPILREEERSEGGFIWEQNPPPPPSSAPPLTGRFNPPQEMVIMMQQEVGEKILEGRDRKPHHSLLSLAMEQACEDIEIVRYVGRESFRPAPKVDSIVLKFIVKKERNRGEENTLIKLWEKAFTHPRKTLISNLKRFYDIEILKSWLSSCGYDDRIRAEAVRREDWGKFL